MATSLLVFVALIGLSTVSACKPDQIQECTRYFLSKVTQFANELTNVTNNYAVDREDTILTVCGLVREYRLCLTSGLPGCPPEQVDQVDRALSVFGGAPYHCAQASPNGNGNGGYRVNNTRYRNAQYDVRSKSVGCNKTAVTACVRDVFPHMQSATDQQDMEQFCRLFEEFRDCTRPILQSCSPVVANQYITSFQRYNDPPYNCSVDLSLGHTPTATQCDRTEVARNVGQCTMAMREQAPKMKDVCLVGQTYATCIGSVLVGCSSQLRAFYMQSFNHFNAKPYDCNITIGTTPSGRGNYTTLSPSRCNPTTVRTCIQGLSEAITQHRRQHNGTISKRSMCRMGQSLKSCLPPRVPFCENQGMVLLERINNQNQCGMYLPGVTNTTGDRKDLTTTAPHCNYQTIKVCMQQLLIDMQENERVKGRDKDKSMCRIAKSLKTCVAPTVPHCDDKSMLFVNSTLHEFNKNNKCGVYLRVDGGGTVTDVSVGEVMHTTSCAISTTTPLLALLLASIFASV